MSSNFYSGTEAELASGATNVVTIVTPAGPSFGLSPTEIAAYTALVTAYTDVLALATSPATRTPVVVENKNVAKEALRSASVNLARTLTGNTAVTNAQLLSLRMNERIERQPRPVPDTPPTVDVTSMSGRLVSIRVHDTATEGRGLPFGAVGAQIFSFVGPAAPSDPRQYHFEGTVTRPKSEILFPDSVASGSTIWLSACWVSAHGETSIGSVPISFTLPGGAIPAAA